MSGEDLLPPFIESCASPVVGCGPTDADRHADPPASDETPEAQHAGLLLNKSMFPVLCFSYN